MLKTHVADALNLYVNFITHSDSQFGVTEHSNTLVH